MAVLTPVAAAAPQARDRLDVYAGQVAADQVAEIVALGVDREELDVSKVRRGAGGKSLVNVEAIISGRQADALRRKGIELSPKKVDGKSAAQGATAKAADGYQVFKKYAGTGGLEEEFRQVAARNRSITKLVTVGRSLNGQDIVALKVSAQAGVRRDGTKPAVLYLGAQHAREWITPEMIRRLMHHVVDGYSRDSEIRRLVDDHELWFVPVANPDGYDYTFEDGQRLWRKNLRDNNGDGQIDARDGVDLNRNFPTKWGYDNEGSSPQPAGETYRGTRPASEPETRALADFTRRVGFEFLVNYHSAAQLLLYGVSWQVSTPSPDDAIYEALAGDDARPAVPGYDPDLSAELYTTNGDTDADLQERFGTLGFTPEMSTCQSASDSVRDDEFEAEDCGSVFEFPDDEGLVQAEFEKNIPFALSVARSADDPAEPESVVGRTTPDFDVDSFEVSYGDPQTVAVVAKRALVGTLLNYRINGGRHRIARASEWSGGERYGDENDDYFVELRAEVRGARPGDKVEVWFSAVKRREGRVRSESFTYEVARDSGARVLVVANEDYKGVNPTYPAGTNAPKHASSYVAALNAAGYSADVWDVDAQGVPHDLGVLSHYDAVVWYLGDNRFTQDPEDELIDTPLGPLPDVAVAERQQYLTIAMRDYLNAGGKLIHAGETAQSGGLFGDLGLLYYGLDGDPSAECVITQDFFSDCLLLGDDFRQYYLGAFTRTDVSGPTGLRGIASPIAGFEGNLGGPVVEGDNPLDEAGSFRPTSEVLPVGEFPQFASKAAALYPQEDPRFAPVEGDRYAAKLHTDYAYSRLTRTVDLTAASSAQLRFQLSLDSEPDYDHLIVEAHTVGQDNWTTLEDLNGATSTAVPADCAVLLDIHPFLGHYLTPQGQSCDSSGSSGEWHSFNGSTDGWREVAFDLSGFAGEQVELSISYVSDSAVGATGAFVDDTRVVVDGVESADGFEGQTSSWAAADPPEGSPEEEGAWQFGGAELVRSVAATSTNDSLLLGVGLEQLASDAERTDLLRRALGGLLGGR